MYISKSKLNKKPLCRSQADDLLYDNSQLRVWISRITGQFSAEMFNGKRWERVSCVEDDDSVQIIDNEEVAR